MPNSCLIESRTVVNETINESETLYAMHCCCQNASKCTKLHTEPNQVFCPRHLKTFHLTIFENHFGKDEYTIFEKYGALHEVEEVDVVDFSSTCAIMFSLKRNFSNPDGNQTTIVEVQYGGKECHLGAPVNLNLGKDCQRQFYSAISEWDFKTVVCCYVKLSTEEAIEEPLKMMNTMAQRYLYGNISTDKIRPETNVTELNEEIFHKCVFYPIHTDEVKVPFCLFFYDEAMNKPVTISMMGITSGLWDNFVFFADIRFTNSLFHENFTDDFCVNVGGCEKKTDEDVSCLSAEKIYLMCYCKRKGREPFYNDYEAYLDVHNLPTFVPYCNKKNASANVPSLQSSSDQFFCYESYTFTSNGDMPNYPTDINTDFGFYNESHGNSSIQNVMDCSSKELTKRCRVGKNNRYTCCCRAHFGLKSPKVGNFSFPTANEDRLYQINARACNNRAMLKRFVDSLTVRKAEDFISNYRFVMKDLEECNFEVSPHKASPYDTALTAERDLLCYFSVKLNNQSGDPSSINAEHYDPVKAHQRRFGIFSVLCNVTNWTAQENAHGCSCRLIEPATPKHRKKMPAEISCCCVAKHAKNYKDTLVDTLFEKIFNVESGNSRKNDKAI